MYGDIPLDDMLMKRFIEWLYVKFVLLPDFNKKVKECGNDIEFDIEFTPDEEFEAVIEASREVKH